MFSEFGVDVVYDVIEAEDVSILSKFEADETVLGLNITAPFKLDAFEWFRKNERQICQEAEVSKSINTVFRGPDGKFCATSTDWFGVCSALTYELGHLDFEKEIAVIGFGGAATAIINNLSFLGKTIDVFVRNLTNVPTISGVSFHHLDTFSRWNRGKNSLVFQTTPVGTKSDTSVVSKNCFNPGQIAMDLIYNPHETTFLKHAQSRGAETVHGIWMLSGQGSKSFDIWMNSLEKECCSITNFNKYVSGLI